jgi:hypothetical protein
MPNRCDAKLPQGLVRQTRKNRLVYFILAESRLLPLEAKAPQPTCDIHNGAQIPWGNGNLGPGETTCPGPLWV